MYLDVIGVALATSVQIPILTHTRPRFFLGVQKLVTMTQVNRWDWRPVAAMRGWSDDGQPDLLLEHEDVGPGPGADNE